jgi:hypothetical protein
VGISETFNSSVKANGYSESAVATATYIIPPDFTLAALPASFNLIGGQGATATVSVIPMHGFVSTVSFTCSGLPAGASCSFSPQTLTPVGIMSSTALTTTLTITTSATAAALHRNPSPLIPGSVLAVAFCCFGWKKRRRLPMLLLLAVSAAGLSFFTGCSAASSTQPTTSTVTVTATSGSLTHTTTFLLTVN